MALNYDAKPHRLAFSDTRHVTVDNQEYVSDLRDGNAGMPPRAADRPRTPPKPRGGGAAAMDPALKAGLIKIAELTAMVKKLRDDAKDMREELAALKVRKAAAEAEIEERQEIVDDAKADMAETKDYLKQLKAEVKKSDAAVAKLKAEVERLQAANAALMARYNEMRKERLSNRDKEQWWPPPWFEQL